MSSQPPHARPRHPVVEAQLAHRASHAQMRVADAITAFAGSMPFVNLHAVAFAHDFVEQEIELKTNTELTREIHLLTTELHRRLVTDQPTSRS